MSTESRLERLERGQREAWRPVISAIEEIDSPGLFRVYAPGPLEELLTLEQLRARFGEGHRLDIVCFDRTNMEEGPEEERPFTRLARLEEE